MEIKAVKLITGQLLTCGVEDGLTLEKVLGRHILRIFRPVIFESYKYLNNQQQVVETISMSPYMNNSTDDFYEIPADYILGVASVRPLALERYKDYVSWMINDAKQDLAIIDEEQALRDEEIIHQAMVEKNHSNLH